MPEIGAMALLDVSLGFRGIPIITVSLTTIKNGVSSRKNNYYSIKSSERPLDLKNSIGTCSFCQDSDL